MRELFKLAFAFLLIFLGFDGVQQHVTAIFNERGMVSIGFNALIIIYLSFVVLDPVAAAVVRKIGSKNAMLVGGLSYGLFTVIIASFKAELIYVSAVVLGAGAALLWTGQNTHLIRISQKELNTGEAPGCLTAFGLLDLLSGH